MEKKQKNDDTTQKLVVITRVLDAPRELVFKAWTDKKQLMRWYAPEGCSIEYTKLNVRPGGEFHSILRTPNGYECCCNGIYLVIAPPERLVFSITMADREGNPVLPTDIDMDPEWPAETIVTVTFAEYEGKTRLTLHQTVLESTARRTGAYDGWTAMLDKLVNELPLAVLAKMEA